MPYHPWLVEMLTVAPQRVHQGKILLSAAEADYLRAAEFPTAALPRRAGGRCRPTCPGSIRTWQG